MDDILMFDDKVAFLRSLPMKDRWRELARRRANPETGKLLEVLGLNPPLREEQWKALCK